MSVNNEIGFIQDIEAYLFTRFPDRRFEIINLGLSDETDSGLDIDALRIVSKGVNKLRTDKNAFIIITHYQRLLEYIVPDFVHVLYDGRIVKSGTKELALELEEKGYDWLKEEAREKETREKATININ